MTKKSYQIPFCKKSGNMLRDVYCFNEIEWKDIYTFSGSLTYKDYGRGRSAVYFIWEDEEGRELFMSLSIMNCLLMNETISNGKTDPEIEWTFIKQGQSYSIEFA